MQRTLIARIKVNASLLELLKACEHNIYFIVANRNGREGEVASTVALALADVARSLVLSVTCALGITAPDVSVTVPLRVAVVPCP